MTQLNLSKFYLLNLFILLQSVIFSQQCIQLPAISGSPAVGSAPPGWNVWQNTPDIISGNGPWPGGTYTVSNVDGVSAAGGAMGLFLMNGNANPAFAEGWATTLTGLTPGNNYAVSCQWQQASLTGAGIVYAGGDLMVIVDGVPTLFTSTGGYNDPWQTATVNFTAVATTATYQFKVSQYAAGLPPGQYGSGIVVDNMICSAMNLGVTINSGTICQGDCFNLMATPTNASGSVTYSWNNGITSTTAGPISVCPSSTTTYQVTATDASGSTATATTTITVNTTPNVNLGNNTVICNGTSLTLNAGNPGSTYLWSNGSGGQTLTVSSSGTYWVTASNGTCSDSDTIVVTFQPLSVNLGNDLTLCNSETMTLDAGNPGAVYLWSDNSTSQQLAVNSAGTYWVTINYGTCEASDTIVVNNVIVDVDLGNDTVVCSGNSVLLDAENPGANYLWSNSSSNQTLTVNSSGTYWVQVNSGTCEDADTINVSVIDVNVDLGNDTTLCEAPSFNLDAGNPGATYLWNDNSTNQVLNVTSIGSYWVTATSGLCTDSDTIVLDFQPFNVDLGNDTTICFGSTVVLDAGNPGANYLWNNLSTNQILNTGTSGTYWVGANLGNCVDSDTINITVININVDLGNDSTLCIAPVLTLNAGNPGSNYTWNDNSSNQQLSVNAPGIYWVTAYNGACSDSDTITFLVQDLNPSFFSNQREGCVPLSSDFINESIISNGTITNWLWTFGDGQTSTLQNPSNDYNSSGSFDVSLTVTSNLGCTETLILPAYINVHPNAIASFNGPFTALGGESVQFVNTSSNSSIWNWNFDNSANYDSEHVNYTFNTAGTHIVTLIADNEFGCSDTVTQLVSIVFEPIVYVPNTFTPDGNEFNQTWVTYISEIDTYDFSLKVFDRWGEMIWESNNPEVGWDGSYGGKMVQSGTYTWVMDFGNLSNDTRYKYSGHVNVLR